MRHSIELPDPKPDWINLSAQTMAFAASKCPEQQCSHEVITVFAASAPDTSTQRQQRKFKVPATLPLTSRVPNMAISVSLPVLVIG